jgi:hypothetical protein
MNTRFSDDTWPDGASFPAAALRAQFPALARAGEFIFFDGHEQSSSGKVSISPM